MDLVKGNDELIQCCQKMLFLNNFWNILLLDLINLKAKQNKQVAVTLLSYREE